MQTFDGSHFQIVFIEVVLQNTGERINNVLNLIINFLKDKNVSHLLLAVISDNNPINAKRVDSQVPRLWDYNHLKAITNVSFTEVLLKDLYTKPLFKNSFKDVFKKFFDLNETTTLSYFRDTLKTEIFNLQIATSRFLNVSPGPDVLFQARYLKNDTLESVGQRWRIGLKSALEDLKITRNQLESQNAEFYPRIWASFAALEFRVDILKGVNDETGPTRKDQSTQTDE